MGSRACFILQSNRHNFVVSLDHPRRHDRRAAKRRDVSVPCADAVVETEWCLARERQKSYGRLL